MSEVLEKPVSERVYTLFEVQKRKSQALRSGTIKERKDLLRKLRGWIMSHRAELRQAVYNDFRKPAMEVETSELFPVLGEIGQALEQLDHWARPQKVDAPITYLGTRTEIRYEPKGTCLIIGPWNYPFNLFIGPLVSCLAAGNTAILKPSEMTPHTSAFIARLVKEVFEPDRVVVVEGDASVATELLRLPFDHIFFTGSPSVGKIVMRAAADNLTSVTLELGGKSPAIIDSTANLEDAARRITFGKFLNNGQTCIAPDYVLIDEKLKPAFIDLLRNNIQSLFGHGEAVTEQSRDYCRIVNRRNFDRLHHLVQDALQGGARPVIAGEANRDTRFFPPTVLTDVPHDAAIMEEEIFGPVLPVIGLAQMKDAIDIVNKKPKPLSLYIFSYQKKIREEILQQTSAGAVCINDCVLQFTHPNVPFGGVNNSGLGKAHGRYGFMAFSNEKPVIRQKRGLTNAYLFYPPYTGARQKILDFLLKWLI